MAEPLIVTVRGQTPSIADDAFVAPGAAILGNVTIAARASIWYGAVLRGDTELIEVGPDSNVQDLCVIHVDAGYPVHLGSRVTVGHRAIIHGAFIDDDVLVGMGAIVMNGARIGKGSLIAAGAVVPPGVDVPEGSLVAGVPGRVVRPVRDSDVEAMSHNVTAYLEHAAAHAEAVRALG